MTRLILGLIDRDLYRKLKQAARAERRSVNNELAVLLERGTRNDAPAALVEPDPGRPGTAALVITELSALRGPAGGTLVLPSRLFGDPAGRPWDLGDSWSLREAYRLILMSATGAGDLSSWLNAARLIEAWPELGPALPGAMREAWEKIHPVLAKSPAEG